jgi:beta-lactam-binding protein with PASTA domain
MNPKVTTVSVVAGLALLTLGCGENPGRSADTTPTTGAPPTSTVSVTTTASPASWVMPNLVGANLQAAQDAIQALTTDFVFFTSSTDATGQGRPQVLDSNWKVCAQNIPPGGTITTTTKIEFATVKLTEQCP